eukprot:364531-Chlamydomonas_euryale.AAC.1
MPGRLSELLSPAAIGGASGEHAYRKLSFVPPAKPDAPVVDPGVDFLVLNTTVRDTQRGGGGRSGAGG